MDRTTVINCLNTGNITFEFIQDWAIRRADNKLTSEQLSWVINQVVNQMHMGFFHPSITEDITHYYEINEIKDKAGNHIRWY